MGAYAVAHNQLVDAHNKADEEIHKLKLNIKTKGTMFFFFKLFDLVIQHTYQFLMDHNP